MKTIETTFSYDEGMNLNCKRSGIIKISRSTINVDHIVSISPWEGKLIYEGRQGTQIKDINGKTHLDDRTYDDFLSYIKNGN